jgi:hypothetical protein
LPLAVCYCTLGKAPPRPPLHWQAQTSAAVRRELSDFRVLGQQVSLRDPASAVQPGAIPLRAPPVRKPGRWQDAEGRRRSSTREAVAVDRGPAGGPSGPQRAALWAPAYWQGGVAGPGAPKTARPAGPANLPVAVGFNLNEVGA